MATAQGREAAGRRLGEAEGRPRAFEGAQPCGTLTWDSGSGTERERTSVVLSCPCLCRLVMEELYSVGNADR